MKTRLDQLLVDRRLAESKTRAQAIIMAGLVQDENGRMLTKPGHPVASDIILQVKQSPQYASRAGNKLASVAGALNLDLKAKIVLDIGSSTGGFTDYALQNGATKVYSVDVGTNQLAYKLRIDPRVTVMEQTDIRDVTELPDKIDCVVADVSFISLTKVLPGIKPLLSENAVVVAMAKPQFEAGKDVVDRFGGVISDETTRAEVLEDFEQIISEDFQIIAKRDSSVHGTKGNIERFYKLRAARVCSVRSRVTRSLCGWPN